MSEAQAPIVSPMKVNLRKYVFIYVSKLDREGPVDNIPSTN
jgi:hypothetical protein